MTSYKVTKKDISKKNEKTTERIFKLFKDYLKQMINEIYIYDFSESNMRKI